MGRLSPTARMIHSCGRVHVNASSTRCRMAAGGRVAESGSHAALLAQGGLYAELFSLQAQGYLGERE